MTATPSPTAIPFARLVASDAINARASTKDGLDELAASIATKGLIQPLAVRPQDGSNKYEIIDGRRRYQALAKLVKAGKIAKTFIVPIHVRNETDGEALETSLMANTVRLPMHPVEQHEVFARLADAGTSVADIAARFGLAERTVRQQLALGRLAPPIRDAWRKGKLDAGAAQAYAGSGADHAAQAAHYDKAKKQGSYALSPHAIRADLTRQRTSAAGIPQATLDLYVARGGTISDDLFEADRYVDDALLLAAVRRDRAAGLLETLKAEGWGWVAMASDLPGGWRAWRELPEPEWTDEELDGCNALDGDAYDAEYTRLDLSHWTAEQKASAGAVVAIRHDGSVEVHRGYLRPASADTSLTDDEASEAVAGLDDDGEIDHGPEMEPCPDCAGLHDGDCEVCGGTGEVPVEDDDALPSVSTLTGTPDTSGDSDDPYAISGALMETITTAQTLAAATAIRLDPNLALRLAVAALSVPTYDTPVELSATRFTPSVGREAENDFDTMLATLVPMSQEQLLRTLAQIVADSINLRQHHADAKRKDDDTLVSVLDPDDYRDAMLIEFSPSDYFKRATKATALAAIDELREAGFGAGLAPVDMLADMKKTELAEAAATIAAKHGWLPPQLRHPAYALIPATDGAA